MINKKLGKRPYKYDSRTLQFEKYGAGLDTLPVTTEAYWPNPNPLGMLLNDQLGDCVVAARYHQKMVWLQSNGVSWYATDLEALNEYEIVGGYKPGDPSTDNGIVILDMLKYLKSINEIFAYMQVNPSNTAQVKQAIRIFGGVMVGWQLPASLDENSTLWVPPSNLIGNNAPGTLGGHCTIAPGFNSEYLDNITWGERIGADWGYLADYCDEMWVQVSNDWIEANGKTPTGINMTLLMQDLKIVSN